MIIDIKDPYGGYKSHWQALGILVPAVGLVAFLGSMCINVYEEPFDKDLFEDMNQASVQPSVNKVEDGADNGAIELKADDAKADQPADKPAEEAPVSPAVE